MGGKTLNHPVVGMVADPATGGYWEVASDGGVFSFDARFKGSTGAIALNQPVVGMAATSDGGGYWMVAADGGIFAFGDAAFRGSMGGIRLVAPVSAMTVDPHTGGYWLVAADGGLFSFGAPFAGSASGQPLARRMVAMVTSPNGGGYLLVDGDGSVRAYGGAVARGSVAVLPLAGLVVTVDPGHDGGNGSAPQIINQLEDSGGFLEACDTAGTETADGYTEHAFNFDVASRAATLLEAEGATVVLTRTIDTGVGPCVNQRATIGNDAHAAAAISIHADGGPPSGQGFTVDTPSPVVSSISNNTAIVTPSAELGIDVRDAFEAITGEPVSNYAGQDGVDQRSDLGGLNLSMVPKVLIECANMRTPAGAAMTEDPAWRQLAAQGVAKGITAFLTAELRPA
jgi:N-acetylmuramoyl-L-alanine amidase